MVLVHPSQRTTHIPGLRQRHKYVQGVVRSAVPVPWQNLKPLDQEQVDEEAEDDGAYDTQDESDEIGP